MSRSEPIAAAERTYIVLLQPEPEGGFTVTCPSLPGLVTYGETLEEARVVAGEALMPSIRELLSPRQSSRGQITGRRIYSSYRNTPLA